jgi:hypothetical protein
MKADAGTRDTSFSSSFFVLEPSPMKTQQTEDEISDVPLAVLLGLDGTERVWPLMTIPPPRELLVPRPQPMSVIASVEGSMTLLEHRRFVLRPDLRSSTHRWWNVYNEGRSRTPEDAFVYLEASR